MQEKLNKIKGLGRGSDPSNPLKIKGFLVGGTAWNKT
jgi:hypothetical protein